MTQIPLQTGAVRSIFLLDIRRDPRKRARQPGGTSQGAVLVGQAGPSGDVASGRVEATKCPARAWSPRPPGVFFGRRRHHGQPALSRASNDPDHHLWRNGRLWWIAFTVHLPGWQKERIRLSLGTDDLIEARRRRDQLLRDTRRPAGCELSLRIAGRKRRARRGTSRHMAA